MFSGQRAHLPTENLMAKATTYFTYRPDSDRFPPKQISQLRQQGAQTHLADRKTARNNTLTKTTPAPVTPCVTDFLLVALEVRIGTVPGLLLLERGPSPNCGPLPFTSLSPLKAKLLRGSPASLYPAGIAGMRAGHKLAASGEDQKAKRVPNCNYGKYFHP